MNFIFHRDRVVATRYGHVLGFKKGVPTHVPPDAVKDVIAAGGVPEDDTVDTAELTEDKKPVSVIEPVDPLARKAALFAAFEKLALENKRGNFTAGGLPHPKALEKALGWEVPGAERDEAWAEFRKGDGK